MGGCLRDVGGVSLSVVLVWVIIALVTGNTAATQPITELGAASVAATATPQPIEVTAAKLIAEYDANEVAADIKYKNKTVSVTGEVGSISEVFGRKYVSLSEGGLLPVSRVHCQFENRHTDQLVDLRKGQEATLLGAVDGYDIGNVTVSSCTVVE